MPLRKTLPILIAPFISSPLLANEPIEELNVMGRQANLIGESVSASQGYVDQFEIKLRPLLRTGELLELVPGMVATQHSGSGKANQYFLRGFNLDHGTDFATFIDGMPVNMRTHGHGQGYTDINFLIPELVDSLAYKKGPYYVETGDFSGAGAAQFSTATRLTSGEVELSFGENSYQRFITTDSISNIMGGELLFGLELQGYDGPWKDINEEGEKTNFLVKHTRQANDGERSIVLMGYDNNWNSADQIPSRAVNSGLIDELGSLDTDVGGESSRYSLSTEWKADHAYFSAYVINYDLDLTSNFTYFLDDTTNGDRFQQIDERTIYGGQGHYHIDHGKMRNTLGGDIRFDDISEVGLKRKTVSGFGAVRLDEVEELSAGFYVKNQMQWTSKFKTTIGLRYDYFDFDVNSLIDTNVYNYNVDSNSGSDNDDIISLKGNASYAFTPDLEGYFSIGEGFHSNDARGTTTVIDPVEGTTAAPVDPLVESLGYEIGFRQLINDQLNISASLWYLELDSELLFVGDAGNTEASRSSKRNGIELTAYWRMNDVWTADLEYAYSNAEFDEKDISDPTLGDDIPGAVEDVIQLGISANFKSGYYGSFRIRYFGEEPLEESGSIKGESATVANLMLAKDWNNFGIKAEVLNVFDSDDRDVEYLYESQLAGEASPTEDIHYKIFEPRTFRLSGHLKF
ncbi:TonB-dependent receptor [bacterium]|nr:TonB-dependent receptor [bacterium]